MAMAASHLSLIGRDALTDLRCASLSFLMYSGTRGSSAHQPRVAESRETMSVAQGRRCRFLVGRRSLVAEPCCSK